MSSKPNLNDRLVVFGYYLRDHPELLIAIGLIVGAIVVIVGLDWLATDAVRELEDWIRSRLKKGKG